VFFNSGLTFATPVSTYAVMESTNSRQGMANNIYQESAEAIEDASICLLPKELMDELLRPDPLK
jgi:hypothetical protein